jgi:hypothetical protein
MRLSQISLQLWLVTACTGGVASPPPGQPSPPQTPNAAAPEVTTLEETEAQLRADITRTTPTQPHRRFVTVYYVNDRTAIDLFTDWFRRQQGVAAVRLNQSVSRTRAQGAGSREAGAVYLAEETWWGLEIEGPLKELGPGDVAAWIRLLQGVPADIRWRLGPSIVTRP